MTPGLPKTLDSAGFVVGAPDTIFTYTGRTIRPLDPDPQDICIEDIAHALSNQCRFTGHTRLFYSVAEHSVLVAMLCKEDLRLEALLHDASEAYLSDVASPVKRAHGFAETYSRYEMRLERAIAKRFNLPERLVMNRDIKWADQRMLEEEVSQFCHPAFQNAMGVTAETDKWGLPWGKPLVEGWPPYEAERIFLRVFYDYYREKK